MGGKRDYILVKVKGRRVDVARAGSHCGNSEVHPHQNITTPNKIFRVIFPHRLTMAVTDVLVPEYPATQSTVCLGSGGS